MCNEWIIASTQLEDWAHLSEQHTLSHNLSNTLRSKGGAKLHSPMRYPATVELNQRLACNMISMECRKMHRMQFSHILPSCSLPCLQQNLCARLITTLRQMAAGWGWYSCVASSWHPLDTSRSRGPGSCKSEPSTPWAAALQNMPSCSRPCRRNCSCCNRKIRNPPYK